MSDSCPHCPPDRVWPHEHVGETTLPLLLIVRDHAAHKEWYFHGTQAQCDALVNHPRTNQQEVFDSLLLRYKDWDKALKELGVP